MARFQRNGGGRNGGSQEGKKPLETVKLNSGGGFVEVAIWENEGDNGVNYSVTAKRSYHDGKDWQDTKSFRHQEIPHLVEALREAYLSIQGLLNKK